MLLRRLKVSGMLSFGPKGLDLALEPLNVLIGPNGSGKSNFLEAIGLLRSATSDLAEPIARRGGPEEFFWKGPDAPHRLHMEATVNLPQDRALRHSLDVANVGGRIGVADETVEGLTPGPHYQNSESPTPKASMLRVAPPHTELWYLKEQYEAIRLYRDWRFGPEASLRAPCGAHGRNDFLDDGGGNLALVLSQFDGDHKQALLDALRSLFEGIVGFRCPVTDGTVGLFLEEKGNRTVPATLLSDGALRYLCLLAVLLHPKPPPLICIEGPELGLHPDLLPTLSDLMRDASQRSQIVVATHSDVLVDTLTDQPESVVICEKHDGETEMRRLERADLSRVLNGHGLGDLWTSGELGGNRW